MNFPYELPKLEYAFDAMEPYIDKETMEIHYTKHHQAYINNLNVIMESHPELQSRSVESLITDLSDLPADVRTGICNQGGGTLNHTLFWTYMKKNGGGMPRDKVMQAIKESFGTFDAMQEQFNATSKSVFGSGWSWLCVNPQGKLIIEPSFNQDCPLTNGNKPIMGLDVWEHAYYLKYQNRRPDYIGAWWHVLDWDRIEEYYRGIVE